MKTPSVSVIIPICGGADELGPLLRALKEQTAPPTEVIIVDNDARPQPPEPMPAALRYVHNTGRGSISDNYNLGLKHATGELVLLTQQDCLPASSSSLETLIAEFLRDDHTVAATALVTLPEAIFRTYGFWGRVLMAKWVGTTRQGISGKLDMVRRDVFLRIGGYDGERFRFAGEDVDLCVRLQAQGQVVVTNAEVIHHHNQNHETTAAHVWRKHFAYAEGFGACLRRHGTKVARVPYAQRWTHHLNKFLYPVLLLFPWFPISVGAILLVMTNVAQFQSFRAGSVRLLFLLVFNPLCFLAGLAGTLVGFLGGKQTLRP